MLINQTPSATSPATNARASTEHSRISAFAPLQPGLFTGRPSSVANWRSFNSYAASNEILSAHVHRSSRCRRPGS